MDKKLPSDWERILGIIVMDPDGWDRQGDFEKDWFTPITKEEFMRKAAQSTCKYPKELL